MKANIFKSSKGIVAILLISWFTYGCNTYAQNNNEKNKSKNKHKKTEYVHLKIEKDEDGKVTKIDTVFNSENSQGNAEAFVKSFHFDFPDFGHETKDEPVDDNDEAFSMDMQMGKLDSIINIDIMKRLKIECDGKEGHESVKIICDVDDEEDSNDGSEKSLSEKIKNINPFVRMGKHKKMMVININDKDINFSMDDNGKKDKKSKVKIIMKSIMLDDATTDEKKIAEGSKNIKTGELEIDDLRFSPNPSNGKFNLNFELDKKADVEIKIVDLKGKEIYHETLRNFSGDYEKDIDITKASKGIYLLYIKQENKSVCKKVMIQ